MPYASPIEVAQAALHRVGEDTIASLDDGSTPALIFASNYRGIVEDLLTRHAWTWATKTVDLTLIGAATSGAWAYAFAVPAGVLNVRKVTCAGFALHSGDWAYEDGQILTLRNDPLQAIITYNVPEARWPGDFAECVVDLVKALFMEGLLDKWQEALVVRKAIDPPPPAAGKLQLAMVRDKRQVPASKVETTPLADAWRGARVRNCRR